MTAGSRLSRRAFLRRTTTAGALLATPLVIPSHVLGQAAPSHRINIGLVGMGVGMASLGPPLLNRDDLQVVAVCDVERRRRERAKAQAEQAYARRRRSGQFKGCEAVNEHELITDREDIDAVVIATPDHWHGPITLAAIRRGKDVYVEKPMTLTVREGRVVADLARQYGTILQVGSQQRSERGFRRACEMVRNGWIGKVEEVRTVLGDFPPVPPLPEQPIPEGFDYDRWLGPAPWEPYHEERVRGSYNSGWRRFWDYGDRKQGDWGAHHFDIIQWALNQDQSGPVQFLPKGHEKTPFQTYLYADGTKVFRDKPTRNWCMIQFIGPKGEICISRGDRVETTPAELRDRPLEPGSIQLYASTDHMDNWIQCMKTRQQPICPPEVGHRSATVCHLSAICERLNRPIRWDPVKEEILDDEDASRWLDRARRAPYVI